MRNKPLLVISEYDVTTPCYTKERSLCNRTVHEVKGILTAGEKYSKRQTLNWVETVKIRPFPLDLRVTRSSSVWYNYIVKYYKVGEPIFLKDLPGKSRDYLRQEMKGLVDEGKMERLSNGVYYLPYTTAFGTEGTVYVGQYVEKKYLSAGGKVSGYVTGMQLVNQLGFTTQNPARYEVSSMFAISTILAMLIIILLPIEKIGIGLGLLLIGLTIMLAFVSNTVHIVALAMNKENMTV